MLLTWPPPLEQMIRFIAYNSLIGRAPRTVRQYVSGIAFHCKINNIEDITQKFIVRKLLNGLDKSSSRVDNRLPITFDLLGKLVSILPAICISKYEETLFKSMFLTAYFGFFRLSELVLSKSPDVQHAISVDNVSIVSDMLQIFVQSSKTDQTGKGALVQISSVGGEFCPVMAVKQFQLVRPSLPGPFYCHFSGQPVSRYQFNAVLKKALSALGLAKTNIKSHSFRIGAATEAALAGLSDTEIKGLGRWQSNAFKGYIRIPVNKIISHS